MKKVCLEQWYNVNDSTEHGYALENLYTEEIYYKTSTKEQCEEYARKNNMKICYEF